METFNASFSLLCQSRSEAGEGDGWGQGGPRGQLPFVPHFDLHRDRSDLFILVKKEIITLHCIGLTHKLSYPWTVCCYSVCSNFSPGNRLSQASPNLPGQHPSLMVGEQPPPALLPQPLTGNSGHCHEQGMDSCSLFEPSLPWVHVTHST